MKTIDQIKEMNIPIGAPIELTLNTSISNEFKKNPNNETFKQLGYFQRIEDKTEDDLYGTIIYNPTTKISTESGCMIPYIEDIKMLDYKK